MKVIKSWCFTLSKLHKPPFLLIWNGNTACPGYLTRLLLLEPEEMMYVEGIVNENSLKNYKGLYKYNR